jgi:hypothetical protein
MGVLPTGSELMGDPLDELESSFLLSSSTSFVGRLRLTVFGMSAWCALGEAAVSGW